MSIELFATGLELFADKWQAPGVIDLKPSGDLSDYLELKTTSNRTLITAISANDNPLVLGKDATTGHSLDADDVIFGEDIEVDGMSWLDGGVTLGTSFNILDNILFTAGTDNDIAYVLNSAGVAADTTLTNVIEGTPRRMATGANSLLLSNITNDGDIQFLVSDGGSSWGMLTFNGDDHSAHFGQDDYGVDVKLYGETASAYCLWDTSADALYITGSHDAGSEYSLKIVDTATFVAVAAHKSAQVELTYAPSSAGTACPIAVVGKLTLNGDLTAANNYPGMGWGIQGQLHIATGSTIDGSTYGDPGAVYAGVRGVLSDAGTSTYTKGILTGFFGDIQLTQNASSGADFKVYGAYLYLYSAAGNTNVDALLCLDKHASATDASVEKGIYIRTGMTTGIDIDPAAGTIATGIDIGTCTTGISLTGTFTKGIDFANATITVDAGRDNTFWSIGTYGSYKTVSLTDHFLATQINLSNDTEPAAASKKLVGSYVNLTTGVAQGTYGRLKGIESYIVVGHALLDGHAIYGELYYTGSTTGITNEGMGVGGTVDTTGDAGEPGGLLYGGKFRIKGDNLRTGSYGHMAMFIVTESSTHTNTCIENLSGATVTNMLWLKNDETAACGLRISGGTITADIILQNGETISNAVDGTVAISGELGVGDISFLNNWKLTEDDEYGVVLLSPERNKYRMVKV